MARAALATGETPTMRRLFARLAARAGPRDYRGQLGELFREIVKRWRYVAEPGEWVSGTPRAVLGNVLGLSHWPGLDPLNADVLSLPDDPTRRGWGDCDDVATLTAAGAHALGMRPFFRVARGPDGAHVSVTVITPAGERVELDPVGHPDHGPGWALEGPEIQISHYDLTKGRETMALGADPSAWRDSIERYAPQFEPYDVDDEEAHAAIVHPGDMLGERILTLPDHLARRWARGVVVDETPAVDQFGDLHVYDADTDLWLPPALAFGRLGRRRGRRRGERVQMRQRRRRRWQQRVQRVAQPLRRVGARVLSIPALQQAIASSLQATGTPVPVTMALLKAAAGVLRSGGILKLYKMARRNPRAAMQLLAQQAAKVRGANMAGILPGGPPLELVDPSGVVMAAAPIRLLVGSVGAPSFGSVETTPTPTAGSWYRVQGGDNLLDITRAAYPVANQDSAARLERARWIADANANAVYKRAPKNEFEEKHFPGGLPRLVPIWAPDFTAVQGASGGAFPLLWIPPSAGVEPPPYMPAPPSPAPEPPAPTPAPPPPSPAPVPLPPPVPPPAPTPSPDIPAPVPAPVEPPAPPKDQGSPGGGVGKLAAAGLLIGLGLMGGA